MMLKRKSTEASACTDDSEYVTAENIKPEDENYEITPPSTKKQKLSVHFDGVTVYYFKRAQGFTCVPSEGGSTLGMTTQHSHIERFSVAEFNQAQKKLRRQTGYNLPDTGVLCGHQESPSSSGEMTDDSEDDSDSDECSFLQPVPIRQRRMMLRCSGVKKIEISESDGCKDIRLSREVCGCDCTGGVCVPETCSCNQAGINCQVDRMSFPCACTKSGCGNSNGRIEFNPYRVRTHFVHTLMRVEMERSSRNDGSEHSRGGNHYKDITRESIDDNEKSHETAESIDLSEYNSNEHGSCRDCQQSEVCQILMREAEQQFTHVKPNCQPFLPFTPTEDMSTTPKISQTPSFTDNSDFFAASNEMAAEPYFTYNKVNSDSYLTLTESTSLPLDTLPNCIDSDVSSFCTTGSFYNRKAQVTYPGVTFSSSPAITCNKFSNSDSLKTNIYSVNGSSSTWDEISSSADFISPISSCTVPPASYTTMTNTTSDEIAETCPGILTHLRQQDVTNDLPDFSHPSYSTLNSKKCHAQGNSYSNSIKSLSETADMFGEDLTDTNTSADILSNSIDYVVQQIIEEGDHFPSMDIPRAMFPDNILTYSSSNRSDSTTESKSERTYIENLLSNNYMTSSCDPGFNVSVFDRMAGEGSTSGDFSEMLSGSVMA